MVKQGQGSQLTRLLGRVLGHTGRGERPAAPTTQGAGMPYPGDFWGAPEISYQPNPDNGMVPDPGEIFWTYVPYEEDHRQGKDRPVLVIGYDRPWLLALPLTSKDHDRDAAQEAAAGRHWMDIGSGPWDSRGRDSEVRLDRILRVDPVGVRREGATLDRDRFERVAAAVRAIREPAPGDVAKP